MRTRRAVVGILGMLLTTLPSGAFGGPPRLDRWVAFWYGKHHERRKTASGERFSRSQLTAAHRSLPLGTKVQVTNLRTGQHMVVRINDCGLRRSSKGRIIDHSEAAAQRAGLLARGMERVQVVVVERAS